MISTSKYEVKKLPLKSIPQLIYSSFNCRIQPDLKKVVFCIALRDSIDKENTFDNIWKLYTKPDIVNDKIAILQSFSCAKDETTVNK